MKWAEKENFEMRVSGPPPSKKNYIEAGPLQRLEYNDSVTDLKAAFQYNRLALCILETSKQVLWQTVKTQMKCRIIRVCTVC